MSIIFEALKKVTKEDVVITQEIAKQLPEAALKNAAAVNMDSSAANMTKPTLVSVGVLLIGTILALILVNRGGISVTKGDKQTFQPVDPAVSNAKSTPVVEGYAPSPLQKQEASPIGLFKMKPPNPKLSLSGIIYGIGKPAAIIDNKILEEGSSVRGAKIVKIYSDKVDLLNESSGEIFTLKVY